MLKMNAEQARREAFARQSVLRRLENPEVSYNTGAALMAADANEYISYCLAMPTYSGWFAVAGPYQVESISSTGGIGFLINQIKAQPCGQRSLVRSIVTPADMVNMVRKTFGLNVRDAAKVFRVSRPTIYQWESLLDIEQIRAHKDRERLKQLYRVAQNWSVLDQLSGRWLNETLPDGLSVLDRLSDDTIDEGALLSAHDQLLAALSQLNNSEHDRSMDAAKAMKAAFKRLASNEKNIVRG